MDQAQAMVFLANAWLKVKPETINGMLPDLPGKFDNKVTDVSQLNLEADESEMIVCYTTSTTNNEETAEGNIDETEENDNTEQDEQRVDIVECKKRLREAYETILMYEVPLDDLDRKLHRRIRMTLADSCAELNKSKEQTDLRSYFCKRSRFSAEYLDEIITYSNSHNELGRPLPTNIEDLLSKLDKKNTFRSIYDEFDAVKADPIYNPEEYWVKRSILDYVCLFIENEKALPRRTKQNLLEDVYGFIKKSYRLSNTTVETASASMYSGENKNVNQTIGSMSKVCRKQSSERADLVFKHLSHENGYLEIGLEDERQNGTKEMNEMSIKTPIMMKNFAYHLVQQYKIDASKIITIGLIISGFNISGLLMTHDRGSIAMIKSTERLHTPKSATEIAHLLPPILKLVYNCAQATEEE
ncbi:hypothetical protein G6F46_002573 [Rhizopus delemar]|nr:hypothetical protein G6F54_001963 [Rhizopus delemar]KAG1516506.1 hypothetical protein G6F53_002113 [Rhizopus delemar]KAG1620220.1 hypothetical protein G6F46_002573 [Rhizopus delemar]